MIPYLKLRASEEAELLGMDDDQHGEFSYDYVEVRRDFLAWSPARDEPASHGDSAVLEPTHGIQEHQSMVNASLSDEAKAPVPSTPEKQSEIEKTA